MKKKHAGKSQKSWTGQQACTASTDTECALQEAHLCVARQALTSLWAHSRHQDSTPNLLYACLCHRMGWFETATILRSAPWLTMIIFVWSIVSGLFGGKQHDVRCRFYGSSAGQLHTSTSCVQALMCGPAPPLSALLQYNLRESLSPAALR